MDDAWNEYVAKKQRKCYDLIILTSLLMIGIILISVALQIKYMDQFDRIFGDVILSIGLAIVAACFVSYTKSLKHY